VLFYLNACGDKPFFDQPHLKNRAQSPRDRLFFPIQYRLTSPYRFSNPHRFSSPYRLTNPYRFSKPYSLFGHVHIFQR
jgi:hypothetical protein